MGPISFPKSVWRSKFECAFWQSPGRNLADSYQCGRLWAVSNSGEDSAIFAFDLWMLQRPLDFLATLQGEQREAALSMLKEAQGERLADFPPYPRLTRRQFRLVVE